ncbi:MAG: hypothetical protein ACSHXD_20185 [Marinosulfonomonas sp.]
MAPEKLEGAYQRILEILRARPEDGRKLVPVARRLEQELLSIRNDEDDYERYLYDAA